MKSALMPQRAPCAPRLSRISLFREAYPHESFGPYLRSFDEFREFVNLFAEHVYSLGCDLLVAYDQKTENVVEHVGSDLLLGVAPRTVGRAMALYYESVEAEIHRLLAKRSHQLTASSYMARVAHYGQ